MRRAVRFTLFGIVLLALIGAVIGGPSRSLAAQESPSQLVIAVARFEDRSGSSLANVGEGVADLLTEKLVNAGYHVVERASIDTVLLERGLNPLVTGDLAQAAQILGADLLVKGSVIRVDIQEMKISLGFVSVSGAAVTTALSSRLVSVYTTEIMGAPSAEADAEGTTGFSLNIGQLISPGWRSSVCTGGLRTDKSVYYQGEIINIGYLDPSPFPPGPCMGCGYYGDVTGPSGTFLLGYKRGYPSSPCITWTLNPSPPLLPGIYTIRLYHGVTISPFISTTFTVVAGGTPPAWMSEITVGTEQFRETIVGQAVDEALDKLVVEIGDVLQRIEPQILAQRAAAAQPQLEAQLKGRVVDIWEDGTIVIGLGREDGVDQYDIFEVYDAVVIHDPNTGELIEVIPATDTPKGEIIVSRVENRVSLASKVGSDFQVNIGDLVTRKEGD